MKKIVASLEYGKLWHKGILLYCIWIIAGFLVIIFSTIYSVKNFDMELLLVFLGFDFLFFVIIYFSVYCLVYNNSLRKKINHWLEDAIELKVFSKKVDSFRLAYAPTKVKIKVEFNYNGKKIKKMSGNLNYVKYRYNTKAGYNTVFYRFADREINILYSPKFDQVLILKDK